MRDNALDCLRGLLIVYIVIVIHGIFWLRIAPDEIGSLILFEMPAIFFISGYAYFLYEKHNPIFQQPTFNWKAYTNFAFARAFRILLPYFCYVIVCIITIKIYGTIKDDDTIELHQLAMKWLNPFVYGGIDPHSMLDNHLWFVHVFLLVALAMPIVTRLNAPIQLNLLIVIPAIALLLFILSKYTFIREETIKHSFFYLLFSLFGYHVARARLYFEQINFIKIAVYCALALLVISIVTGDMNTMNMQLNKFPPNHNFFLFSCIWISLFLYIAFKQPNVYRSIEWIQHNKLFKPFMQYGYSIFLWQGFGYSLAMTGDKYYDVPSLVVWLIALGLSVWLGTMFGPIEKLRFKRQK